MVPSAPIRRAKMLDARRSGKTRRVGSHRKPLGRSVRSGPGAYPCGYVEALPAVNRSGAKGLARGGWRLRLFGDYNIQARTIMRLTVATIANGKINLVADH